MGEHYIHVPIFFLCVFDRYFGLSNDIDLEKVQSQLRVYFRHQHTLKCDTTAAFEIVDRYVSYLVIVLLLPGNCIHFRLDFSE